MINGDQDLLHSMIEELIANAIKYSPQAKPVEISVIEKNEDYLIEVRDFGSGIPENDREKIFERFYRRLEEKKR